MKRIAVIGSGLSGLTLGQKLSKKADVFVFEKARGVGGRMSTRYTDLFVFDHGASYWTVKTKDFQNFLTPLMGSVVAEWRGPVITLEKDNPDIKNISESSCFVAIPNMNSLCKHLAIGLNIETQCEVTGIKATNDNKWHLISCNNEDLGFYDIVISTAPATQTLRLFSDYLPKNHGIYKGKFDSCFALMIGINKPWNKEWIAAHVFNSPIKWIGVNSTKPARNHDVTCLVIHSTPQWTKANLHRDIEEVQDLLLNELGTLITLDMTNLSYVSTHRWLYSQIQSVENLEYFMDTRLGLYAIGDWCQRSDIETVWLNAQKVANFIASKI